MESWHFSMRAFSMKKRLITNQNGGNVIPTRSLSAEPA